MTSPDAQQNVQKDYDEWTTGDEPMTGSQKSYLTTLAQQLGEDNPLKDGMTKAEAGKIIDDLQSRLNK